jgi:hypothetical protein
MISRLGLENGRKYLPLEKELGDPLVLQELLLQSLQVQEPLLPQELQPQQEQVLLHIELAQALQCRYG